MVRIVTTVTLIAFLASTVGCSSTRKISLQKELDVPETPMRSAPGLKAIGWTDPEGQFHEAKGFLRIGRADSLLFVAGKDIRTDVPRNWSDSLVYSIPRERVMSLSTSRFSWQRTTLLVLGLGAWAGLMAALLAYEGLAVGPVSY
jgi:hypothetical protein